jgi:hypothetical protein
MAYSESRRSNREGKYKKHMKNISKTYVKHMEGEGDNEDNIKYKEEKEQFNIFRKEYLGTKKGNNSEFDNFIKKHKDWRDVLPLLLPRLQYQIEAREVRNEKKLFVPAWKNLQTWINQRCWEEEIAVNNNTKYETINRNNKGGAEPGELASLVAEKLRIRQ